MNQSKENNQNVSQELIDEAGERYLEILYELKVKDLIDYIEYEVVENERQEVLTMGIEDVLRDWSRNGLY